MNNKTIYIQFTAGVGPVECAIACEKVLRYFANMYIDTYYYRIIDCEEDDTAGFRSAIVEIPDLTDDEITALKAKWEGTVKYVCTKNTVRPNHRRKNWFIGVNIFEAPQTITFKGVGIDLKWDTMRSHGPGGQHVNTTESAVRVTHIPTGISVRCDAGRNQIKNKEIAVKLLMAKINAYNDAINDEHKNLIWLNHKHLERGNPILTIKGEI